MFYPSFFFSFNLESEQSKNLSFYLDTQKGIIWEVYARFKKMTDCLQLILVSISDLFYKSSSCVYFEPQESLNSLALTRFSFPQKITVAFLGKQVYVLSMYFLHLTVWVEAVLKMSWNLYMKKTTTGHSMKAYALENQKSPQTKFSLSGVYRK